MGSPLTAWYKRFSPEQGTHVPIIKLLSVVTDDDIAQIGVEYGG
jgi:hypothetical protein